MGPSDSQKAHFAYAICKHLNCKGLFVTFNEIQARRMYEDLSFFLGEQVLLFPTKEIIYYDVEAKSNDEIFRRITILDKILDKKHQFIVTSVEAISHKIVSKELFCENILSFKCGSREELGILIKNLSIWVMKERI